MTSICEYDGFPCPFNGKCIQADTEEGIVAVCERFRGD